MKASKADSPLWPRFILFPVMAVVINVAIVVYWEQLSLLPRIALIGVCSYGWFCVAGAFHEAAHQTLFQSPAANLWFGRVVGTFILIPYTAFRETHRTHHAYLNTPDDLEMWPYNNPRCPLALRRVLVWIDIVAGIVTTPFIHSRILLTARERLSLRIRRTILAEYASIAICWGGVLATIGVLMYRGQVDPSVAWFFWALPLVISPAMNTTRRFVEHLGLSSTDPVLGTRTIYGPSLLTRLCSYFNFDIDIHGPHHRYPRAKHVELPEKLRQLQERAVGGPPLPLFKSYRGAFLNTLPCLWRCPGVGETVLLDLGQKTAVSIESEADESPKALSLENWDRVTRAT